MQRARVVQTGWAREVSVGRERGALSLLQRFVLVCWKSVVHFFFFNGSLFFSFFFFFLLFFFSAVQLSHLIYPLTARVIWAPQMILQPVSSIFPCSPLPSGTWWSPGLSFPWCCLPTSSSVCLVFFPLSLYLERWFWPDLINGRHDHTTAVCVSLHWSGCLRVVQLPAGSWHGLPCW